MRALRSRLSPVRHGAPAAAALVAVFAAAGCSGTAGNGESGPPRLTPDPQYEVAAEMIDSPRTPQERLNACELLDLTAAEVIALTGAAMPEVEPTGSGDLGLICTYGGPGSPERAEAAEQGETDNDTDDTDDDDPATTTAATATSAATSTATSTTASTATSTTTSTTAAGPTTNGAMSIDTEGVIIWDFESDLVPDTFAAGVVEPSGGAEAALAGQPTMLGIRYACSDVRGSRASSVEGAPPAAPGAPAPTPPALPTAYIDCIATPTGGGVEVHTILVSGDRLWHITLLQPEVPRSPETESEALAGLHRVAEHILD